MHGWTCDDTSWTEQVPELSKHYRVITLDLAGHGKSESPKDGKIFSTFEYTEIPGTGQFLMMEKPTEFNQLLTAFVENVK